MDKLRQAAQQALEHVQEFKRLWWQVPAFGNKVDKATREAITKAHSQIFELQNSLHAALAEQPAEQEPVVPKCGAIIEVFGKDWRLEYLSLPVGRHKLYVQEYSYTAPQPRRQVELTDEEIRDLWSWSMTVKAERTANTQQHAFARAVIEAYKAKQGEQT